MGRPVSTIEAPSRTSLALRASPRRSISEITSPSSSATAGAAVSSSTSSGKSVLASIVASMPFKRSDTALTKPDTPPSSCRTEARAAAWPWAPIICITASALARSIRWFRKARFVNSPGCAIRAPSSSARESTAPALAEPP